MQEIWVQSLGPEDPLGKGMATHSCIPTWRIPMEQSALERGDFSKGGEAGELTLETNQDRFLCGKVEILEVEELKWPVVYHLPAFLMEKGNEGISSSVGGKCLGLWEDYCHLVRLQGLKKVLERAHQEVLGHGLWRRFPWPNLEWWEWSCHGNHGCRHYPQGLRIRPPSSFF